MIIGIRGYKMAANDIVDFEIHAYGETKIITDGKFGRIEHTYWSVPKEIIKWFINKGSAPTLKEFDDKMQDHRDKQNKKNDDTHICCSSSFWSS